MADLLQIQVSCDGSVFQPTNVQLFFRHIYSLNQLKVWARKKLIFRGLELSMANKRKGKAFFTLPQYPRLSRLNLFLAKLNLVLDGEQFGHAQFSHFYSWIYPRVLVRFFMQMCLSCVTGSSI